MSSQNIVIALVSVLKLFSQSFCLRHVLAKVLLLLSLPYVSSAVIFMQSSISHHIQLVHCFVSLLIRASSVSVKEIKFPSIESFIFKILYTISPTWVKQGFYQMNITTCWMIITTMSIIAISISTLSKRILPLSLTFR